MEKLIIEPTLNSPRVILDPEKRIFEFSGESRPENVKSFFTPVLEWLEDYTEELSKKGSSNGKLPLEFHFNFEYFNSTSAKFILDIFKTLSKLNSRGREVDVKWHYEEDDEDMLEVGKEMSRMSKLPFEYVESKV